MIPLFILSLIGDDFFAPQLVIIGSEVYFTDETEMPLNFICFNFALNLLNEVATVV